MFIEIVRHATSFIHSFVYRLHIFAKKFHHTPGADENASNTLPG
jgi:phage-related protein